MCVFLAGCGSTTDAEVDEPAATPTLQGKWQVVGFERWGGPWKEMADAGQTWDFSERELSCPDNAPLAVQGTYRIRHREIDIKTPKGREIPGIYSLDGDTLKLCLNCGDCRIRPEGFASVMKSEIWLVMLERLRPAGAREQ
jgi:uncharacterized protein (TIGR03067 family)